MTRSFTLSAFRVRSNPTFVRIKTNVKKTQFGIQGKKGFHFFQSEKQLKNKKKNEDRQKLAKCSKDYQRPRKSRGGGQDKNWVGARGNVPQENY